SDPAHAKLRLALVLWAIVLVVVRFAGLVHSEEKIDMPPAGPAALAFVVAALIAVPVAEKHGAAAAKFMLLVGSVTIFVLIAISLTYSRGALVGLLALPLLALRNPRTWPVLAGALVLIALLAPGGWRGRVENAGSLQAPEIATRVDIWAAATDAFEQRPLLGWGLNNFPRAYVSL